MIRSLISYKVVISMLSLLTLSSCHASKPKYNHILIAFQNPCESQVFVDIDLNEAGKHSRALAAGSSDELIFKGVIPRIYSNMDKRFEMTLKIDGKTKTYSKSEFENNFPREPDSNKEITKWKVDVGDICE